MTTTSFHPAYFAQRLGYGCMRISSDRGRAAVLAAYEAGYRLFDHADIYGGGACETLFGTILRDVSDMRDAICLQSKVGIVPGSRYNFAKDYLTNAIHASMKRLQVDQLDVVLFHRIDLLADPQVVAEVVAEFQAAGKVTAFGLSNASPSQVRMFQAHWTAPIVANQIEWNLDRIDPLTDGTLDQCQEYGINPQIWCPLGGVAYAAWGQNANSAQKMLLNLELDRQAAHYGTDRVGINLAWLLRHPAKAIPLIGSTTPERITSALKAVAIDYSHEDWYKLFIARQGRGMA